MLTGDNDSDDVGDKRYGQEHVTMTGDRDLPHDS